MQQHRHIVFFIEHCRVYLSCFSCLCHVEHSYLFSMAFHMIFHDFPLPMPDSSIFQTWKMWTLNSINFHDSRICTNSVTTEIHRSVLIT